MHTRVRATPTIAASDMERARAFYEETLGFCPVEKTSEGVLFQAGDSYVYVYETSAPRGGNTVLSLDVEDFDAEMKELRDKGVHFEEYDMPNLKTHEGVAEMDGMKGAWFKDSEGNILAITEWRQMGEHVKAA